MKAKYFKKIRSQVKWYKVSYRDDLFLVLAMRKRYWLNLLKMLVSDTINVLDVLLTNIILTISHNIANVFQGSKYV